MRSGRGKVRRVQTTRVYENDSTACKLEVRSIRPEDAKLLQEGFAFTSSETYYQRFHGHKGAFTDRELRYLTDIDGYDHAAIIAVHPGDNHLAGVARYIRSEVDPTEAEFAIIVHDPYQRMGLGRDMLRLMAIEAAANGVQQLRGVVRSDNYKMVSLLHAVFPEVVDRKSVV